MDIDSLYNFAKNIPFVKDFISKYDTQVNIAKSVFKSGGYTQSNNPIEKGFKSVEAELGKSRDNITKELRPFLDNPIFKGIANFVAPGSVNTFNGIVDKANSSTSAQSNGNSSSDKGIARSYPRKFNF